MPLHHTARSHVTVEVASSGIEALVFYGRMPFLTPTLSGVCQEPGITERWQNNTTQDSATTIARRIARTQNKQNNISQPPTPHDDTQQ